MINKVSEILSEYIDIPEGGLKEEMSFQGDLGLNSYELMNIVMAFEEEFSVSIPDRDIYELQTIGDAIKYIEKIKA